MIGHWCPCLIVGRAFGFPLRFAEHCPARLTLTGQSKAPAAIHGQLFMSSPLATFLFRTLPCSWIDVEKHASLKSFVKPFS